MPHTVKYEIKAGDVRKGDWFHMADPNMAISAIDRKVAWTTLTVGEGSRARTTRLRVDDDVIVFRTELTPEERAAARHEYGVEQLRKHLASLLANDPITVAQRVIAKAGDYKAEVFTWSTLPDILQAQALYKHALDILATAHHAIDYNESVADADFEHLDEDVLLNAVASWFYRHITRDAWDSPHDPLSRSTSQISNMLEDLDAWAVKKIVTDFRWTGIRDEIERRVAIAVASKNA